MNDKLRKNRDGQKGRYSKVLEDRRGPFRHMLREGKDGCLVLGGTQ